MRHLRGLDEQLRDGVLERCRSLLGQASERSDGPGVAWKSVPPVSAATTTAIIDGIGIRATFRAGREGRQHAETVARRGREHTEQWSTKDRRQKRPEEAYRSLLKMVEAVRRLGEQSPADPRHWPTRPPLSTHDEQVRVRAAVGAFG